MHDEDLQVRAAAAVGLGKVGDERAIQPLTEALRAPFVGGTARRHRFLGFAVLALWLAVFDIFAVGALDSGLVPFLGGCSWLLLAPLLSYYQDRRAASRMQRAVCDALARVGERSPTADLRHVLPDLREIAADPLQQEPATRAASRRAAWHIEMATTGIEQFPRPSSAPAAETALLPRPGEAGALDASLEDAVAETADCSEE